MLISSNLKNNKDIYASLGLHLLIMIVFSLGLTFSSNRNAFVPQPIMVDLSEVKISTKTNLPPKAEKQTKISKTKSKQNFAAPKSTAAPKEKPKQTSSAVTVKEKVKQVAKKTADKKSASLEKTAKPKTKAKKTDSKNQLSSLLASVEKMKPTSSETTGLPSAVDELAESITEKGVKGGIGGNPELEISISEKDAIASKLRACWNLDAGAKGVLDMQVAIRAYLDKTGKVTDVKIIDSSRYNSDKSFRAIADSARRAVYVCDKKGEDSPFKILAKIYPGQFNLWQELYLQFNPLDGGVF